MSAKGPDEQSLLEDASTLLMFSKTRTASSGNDDKDMQQPHTVPISRAESENVSPGNPRGSLGPASIALLPRDGKDKIRSESVSPTSGGRSNISEKGMVAAAALAAAATVPLPLKPGQRRKTSREEPANESVDSRVMGEWPVPDSYIVDIDSGIISCICGFSDDDGFTIQCDHCNRWQHAICFNIRDIETAPEHHLCNTCQPRKLDPKRARRKQMEKLQRQNRNKNSDSTHRDARNATDPSDDYRRTSSTEINNNEHSNGTGNNNGNKTNNDNEGEESQADYDNMERLEEATEETNVKKRKEDGDIALGNGLKRKKDNALYLSAKDAYLALYLPIEKNEFKDKYAGLFIEKHNDDDWVIPYNKDEFKPIPTAVKPYAELSSVKIFPGFAKLGLYLSEDCSRNDFICEFLGEVDFQKSYLLDPRNHYRIWGTTKPRVLFHPHWPIHIDARLCGNVARYMRRSCKPNVELATIRMPATNELKFVLRATRDIENGEEIHIGWQWDLRHPIWQIINGTATFDSLNDPDKYLLIHSIDTVLGTCDCACGNSNKDCNLQKVKKFSQSLYRTVKSKMNNRYKLNEILNQYQGKKRRQPPILSRMAKEVLENEERAPKVLADYNEKKLRSLAAVAPANGGAVIEGSANGIKPYKQSLMDKQDAKYSVDASSSTFDPTKYDESKVDDISQLPIPIVLEVPLKYPTGAEIGKRAAPESSANPPDTQAIASDKSASYPSISARAKPEERSHSSSAASLPDLADNSKGTLKKKLSFADYRKKQHR